MAIGGKSYSLDLVPGILGFCDYYGEQIAITDGDEADLTIAHEVVHAIADSLGLDPTEDVVDKIAEAALSFVRANKSLVKKLLEEK